ncbi:MAG: IPT/TIG domain-containing protein, partial [Terriglobales bacterium]
MSTLMPINPIHSALLYNGKILIVSGSGNCPPSQSGCPSGPPYGPSNNSGVLLFDPATGGITQFTLSWDMFCNGMVVLSDGRAFINGGSIQYDPFLGQTKSSIFDPSNNTFTDVQTMAHGRWYPTVTNLGDGRLMTFSGQDNIDGSTNKTVEIYTIGSGWSPEYSAGWTPPLYPRMHLLPNGKVFYSGSTTTSMLFDPNAHTWTTVDTTIYSGTRTYGTSVLFPLTPANNYDPRVIIMGGGNPATATTEVIDLGASNPTWSAGPSMSQARVEMNAVILPTGKILALGGSVNDEDASTASLNADLYDPVSDSFSSAGANSFPRLYHSVALLLPDATVWVAGGNPSRGYYESHMEIYKPAYLFNSSGGLAARPTITSAPSAISWNGAFTVSTPDAANISSVVLSRPGASTHSFDMEQRLVGMAFTTGNGTLTVTAPPNGNIAPPGYYMLFLVNTSGVPSVAKFVQLGSSAGNPAPTVTSISPTSGTTAGGTAVTITGTGFLTGATVSLGGTAATGVTVVNSTTITATTAAHAVGRVNVVVTNSDGQAGTLTSGYTYVVINPAPTVTSISPTSGTTSGGTAVNISGTGFLSGATVSVGGTTATGVTVVNSTTITATTAAHAAGAVSVVVTNTDGKSGTLTTGYTYVVINPAPTVTSISPASGTTAGGTAVSITGTGFLAGAMVKLGGTAASGVTVVNSTTISATAPAHAAGAVSVIVTNTDSQSGTLAGGYTYTNPAPSLASVAPNSGTANGGTPFTITGTGFLAGATVKLGGTAATGVAVVNSTTITATTPAHSAGAVDVVVTNTDAQSGTLTNGYAYTANLALGVFPGDPSSATVVAGQTATYTLSLGGGGMSGS